MEEQQTGREQKLLTQPIPNLILNMAFPCIISFLITSVYNLADTFFVSGLGTNATAAVSVNQSLDMIIMMAGSMLAVGSSSYISRLLGAGNKEKASKVLSTAFLTAFIFGIVVLVLGLTFMRPLVRLLGATDTCEKYSMEYATYVLMVAPLMATSFVMNHCLRAEGSATLAMIGMGFGGILNCFLDPLFINTMGLGVAGASMATAISKIVSFSILLYPYAFKRSVLKFSRKMISYSKDIVREVVTVGSSSLFRNGLAIVSGIVLNNLAGDISDSMLAAIGVSNKIMMFPFGIILGFGSGYCPVAGFSWGANRIDRLKQGHRFAIRSAIAGGIVMGGVLALFSGTIIGMFTKTDPELLRLGKLCICLQCAALPVHGTVCIVNMLDAGIGYAKGALLLATTRQGTCFFPIVFPIAYFLGDIGLCSVQALADILSLVVMFPVLKKSMELVREREKLLESGSSVEEL